MRRILIALVMSGAVVVAAPAVATAEHHRAHHHHARHHRSSRRHSRVRHESFGRRDNTQPGSSEQAGTVSSFTDNGDGTGVLTITLNDGSMVTGTVNNNTELECMSSTAGQQGDDNDGDDNGGSNNSGDDSQGSSGDSADDGGGSGDDNGGSGDDNGGQMCSTASLVTGTPVAEANLEITGSGAVWDKVELITP